MTVPDWLRPAISARYKEMAWTDYQGFANWVEELAKEGQIQETDIFELRTAYPDPSPRRPPEWLDGEEEEESILLDPPDPGPLAKMEVKGWVSEDTIEKIRVTQLDLKRLTGVADDEVLGDIQENALHLLGRCNDPRDWGADKNGLVYGMVQSGKTANMIVLMELARRVGYRLFIILAGDKTSLRDQTQRRVNRAFALENGVNKEMGIHSPTWAKDYRYTTGGYMANFRYLDRFTRGIDWTSVIVIKKNTQHLGELIDQLVMLKRRMQDGGYSFEHEFKAMIIDDEADYASQNTNVFGEGTTIHNDIVDLRDVLEGCNTYVGYTATPQACLSADINDPIGYPKDFFWLLEPYMEKRDGYFVPRTYLGAWEVFWVYDRWLINRMGRDEWPHYEKDSRGRDIGIYVPSTQDDEKGVHLEDRQRTEVEQEFLEGLLDDSRDGLESLTDAMLDYMLGCGIRWWRHWKTEGSAEKPSVRKIEDEYPYHAGIIHLSETQPNQGRIQHVVQKHWKNAVKLRQEFHDRRDESNRLWGRWRLQLDRTRDLKNQELPQYEELAYFIDCCIQITEEPIRDHRDKPYGYYPGKPFVYLLNSSDEGMELFYDEDIDPEIRTKKAALIVGGFILSRGLTIEGLSVTVFGRTSRMPMGDAVLQMGRWFGHKVDSIDLISVFLQDEIRNIFSQVAEADRYLRLQIKDAIIHGHKPTEVLLELKNSPFFRSTSPAKSPFLQKVSGLGFSGRKAVLNQPFFIPEEILNNKRLLDGFREDYKQHGEKVHERAMLFRDLPPKSVIRLLKGLRSPDDASQTSFMKYGEYLDEWFKGSDLPPFPKINVAVIEGLRKRRRITNIKSPASEEEARLSVTDRFGPITGGRSEDGKYKGDAFLDKSPEWHSSVQQPDARRASGDDILVVFYRLHPNYVTKKLWSSSGGTSKQVGSVVRKEVTLQEGDPYFVAKEGYSDDELAVLAFAAWTPSGGPMYDVGTNILIDPNQVKQKGREQV